MNATVALLLAVAGGWAAPPGAALRPAEEVHAQLERSVPAAGDTLLAAPPELVLTFSGVVEEPGAVMRLLGAAGCSWTLEARRATGDSRTLTSPLPPLEPGGYRLEWRVVSADGHAISGDFTFFVANVAGGEISAPPSPTVDATARSETRAGESASEASPLLLVTRTGADLALLLVAGMLLFIAWGGRASSRESTMSLSGGLSAAAPLLVGTYIWLWSGETLGGAPDVGARLAGLASLTTGRALVAELVLVCMVPWALLLARRPAIAATFAISAVAVGGFGGHPASYTPLISVPASAAHLVGASAWLGGLLFLVTEREAPDFTESARRVSAVALVSVALVTVTGLVQTWLYLGSFNRLTSSAFGRLVLVKAAGLGALVAFGAHHRFRLLPRAASADGSARLARSVRRELALAAFVVLVAVVLSHTPPTP